MPPAKIHKKLSLHYLGQYTEWLHRIMDYPSIGELKSNHRLIFHDVDFINLIKKKFGEELAREALFHIILDIEEYRKRENRKILYE